MSAPQTQPRHRSPDARPDRWRSWISAVLSAALHGWLLWLLLRYDPLPITPPAGSTGGSPTVVDFAGITREPPPPPAVRPTPVPPKPDPVEDTANAATSRVVTTTVVDADERLVQEVAPPADRPEEATRQAAPAPSANAPQVDSRHRAAGWGMPPGMQQQSDAQVHTGPTRMPSPGRGRGLDSASDSPAMSVGGYQVYYDLRSERRLQEWKDGGMTELAITLPGTRQKMVCPLEVALRRGSGECRLVAPDSDELDAIGDAHQVIGIQQVYRRGELLWRGPRPYN